MCGGIKEALGFWFEILSGFEHLLGIDQATVCDCSLSRLFRGNS